MSEQDNGLQLAVNNLATEMRRANYLNAIGIGGGNTKRPTLYQNLATREPLPSMTSTTCTAATPRVSQWCIVFWMVAGRTIRSSLTVMSPVRRRKTNPWEKKVTRFMKKWWPKVKDADRRNMVGRYSALLLQIKDNRSWNEEVDTALVKKLGKLLWLS